MRQVPEYDLNNPATWVVIRERDVISEREAEAVQRELVHIAGLNEYGKPNLVMRWGVTYLDPMNMDDMPKYYLSTNGPVLVGHQYRDEAGQMCTVRKLEEVPTHKISIPLYRATHLGERRFIVEQYRSPEFLKRSGRYVEHLRRDVEDGQILLKEFPRDGCYDYFHRIETPDGKMAVPDEIALGQVGELWRKQNRSFKEKDAEIKGARRKIADRTRQARREIWHPDNLLVKQEIL
jgi:hypothetical protein